MEEPTDPTPANIIINGDELRPYLISAIMEMFCDRLEDVLMPVFALLGRHSTKFF